MSKECKYMRTKFNYTPNDYDIKFSYNDIPPNIDTTNAVELLKQLQQKTPLTKTLHLNMDNYKEDCTNYYLLHNELSLTINNQTKEISFL